MSSWKTLNKYKLTYFLPDNDDFLHYIDLIFWYHKKHLRLRKLFKEKQIEYWYSMKPINERLEKSNFIQKQYDVNFYIKLYFVLIIIELSKLIEWNKDFKEYLNSNISIWEYNRFYRKDGRKNKEIVKRIKDISSKIVHFRDACVHNEDCWISDYPIQIKWDSNLLKERWYNVYKCKNKTYVEWNWINLKFIVEWPNQIWCFVIWYWKMSFDEFEQVIKYTLHYFYK